MSKPKFNPIISKIELNPEQAVLNCTCYERGKAVNRGSTRYSAELLCSTEGSCGAVKTSNNRYQSTRTSFGRS